MELRLGLEQPGGNQVSDRLRVVRAPAPALLRRLLVSCVGRRAAGPEGSHYRLDVALEHASLAQREALVAGAVTVHDVTGDGVIEHVVESALEPADLGRVKPVTRAGNKKGSAPPVLVSRVLL